MKLRLINSMIELIEFMEFMMQQFLLSVILNMLFDLIFMQKLII